MKVIFFNNTKKLCGVYQYGLRVYDIIKKSSKYDIIYTEVENANDCRIAIQKINPEKIIYNWHPVTMPWCSNELLLETGKRTYVMAHDSHSWPFHRNVICIFIDMIDKDIPEKCIYSLPRPIFEFHDKLTNIDTKSNIIKIGSFGFGFANKGFEKLCQIVNEQFDEAIISLHIPGSYYCDTHGLQAKHIACMCQNRITKTGIKLQLTHHYMTNEEILEFLAKQDINLFLYDFLHGNGISSCIDYATSVNRPIGISNSYMFRHIINPDILVEYNSIKDIIKNGTEYITELKNKWSHEMMINKFEYIMDQ